MRKLLFGLLAVLMLTVPALAMPGGARLGEVTMVAWVEMDTVVVAFANESSTSQSITLRTDSTDSRWRSLFTPRTVDVPGRSIMIEAISLSPSWKGEPVEIVASRWFQSADFEAQVPDLMYLPSYIVQASDVIEVDVDLAVLLEGVEGGRLIIEDYYTVLDGQGRGTINVVSVEGGFKYFPSRKSVEYVRPSLLLSMKAPQVSWANLITFNLVKEKGYGRREVIQGPTVLVFGRNLRFAGSVQEPPQLPRLITR